ncbi:vesicle-associated protein 1-1-like isoform X1 [Brassica napus]|nr:vesicle-associated protein 1-1-like isoform X1 [Brassica napus]
MEKTIIPLRQNKTNSDVPLSLLIDGLVVSLSLSLSLNRSREESPAILIGMSNSELLSVEPLDLQFPFELRKQISCSLYLTNKTDNHVAFKVKTTNPKKYCVRPNTGVVLPRSTCEVLVTMQAQKEAPSDMQCKDKFLLQGVTASPGVTAKDVTPEMFSKEAGYLVEETKLRVTYVAPPQPPSPVHEGSEEGSSPRASVSDNGGQASEFSFQRSSADKVEPQENTPEARALITKLTEEKQSAIQLNNKLQRELDQLRRDSKRSQSGIPLMYVLLVGLIGLILGYIMKRT